jgi:hypothetical protein
LSYPVPWVWIGVGMAGLVGLTSVAGMIIGFKMKRDDRETAKALKATIVPPTP